MDPKLIIGIIIAIVFGLILGLSRGKSSASSLPPEGTTDEDIRDLALSGKKIQAIKWHRAIHNTSLAEAKQAVDELARQ